MNKATQDDYRELEFTSKVRKFLSSEELQQFQDTDAYKALKQILTVQEKTTKERDLGTTEVAKRLRISESYVRKLCDSGELECYKLNKTRRVTEEAIDKYLQTRARRMELHIPNKETEEALKESTSGKDVKSYNTTDELFDDLGI